MGEVLDVNSFVDAVARRFADRAQVGRLDSLRLALIALETLLECEKIEFGDPRFDWTEAGAKTVADEELWYWET